MIANIPIAAAISANAARYSGLMIRPRGSIYEHRQRRQKEPGIFARAKPSHHERPKPSVLTGVCQRGGGWPR